MQRLIMFPTFNYFKCWKVANEYYLAKTNKITFYILLFAVSSKFQYCNLQNHGRPS